MTDRIATQDTTPGSSKIQPSIKFNRIKCEFCDTFLECDLDVSRHLMSVNHATNRDKFVSTRDVGAKTDRMVPNNLTKVLQTLRIRNIIDLEDLAYKGFFDMPNLGCAEIAEELNKVLLKSYVDFEAKDAPNIKCQLLEMIKTDLSQPPPEAEVEIKSESEPSTEPPSEPVSQEDPQNIKQEYNEHWDMRHETPVEYQPFMRGVVEQVPVTVASTSSSRSSNSSNRPMPDQSRSSSRPRHVEPETRGKTQAKQPGKPPGPSILLKPKPKPPTPTRPVVPEPSKESDYVPVLSTIKVKMEPKD